MVVGVTALIGSVTAHRSGHVLLGRGLVFGLVAVGGAALGAKASALVSEPVLLACFAALMLLVGAVMATRQLRARRRGAHQESGVARHATRPALDDPIITFSPTFACQCPRALKVLVTATVVGLLTGFLGVGGGFLVVPALVLALALPMAYAAGTSLVVMVLTSTAALVVRIGVGVSPDWVLVAILTVAAAVGGFLGVGLANRVDPRRLSTAFSVLVLGVALFTSAHALPALL